MRIILIALLMPLVATTALAQWTDEKTDLKPRVREPIIQAALGVGWRFDHAETGKTPGADVGLSVWVLPVLTVQARLSYQPKHDPYFVTRLTTTSFAYGLRIQARHARLCAFGSFELDRSWYHGQTVIYSTDSNTVVGRIWSTEKKDGIALAGGVAYRLNSNVALDLGLRLVFNHTRRPNFSPLPAGDYPWLFPDDLFNPATLVIQTRVGL
ncbi:MAG: hypothetical protein HY851_10180 [candidate division Zixibacteria bacterium]|nr:hypothetical protein [candidate division Zixibacteria bacterium]